MKNIIKKIKFKIKKHIERLKYERTHKYVTIEDGFWRFPENSK